MNLLTEEVRSRFLSEEVPRLAPSRHPSQDQLESFMRAELPRAQAALVVRHLLTQCQQCVRVTRPLWELMEKEQQPRGGRR